MRAPHWLLLGGLASVTTVALRCGGGSGACDACADGGTAEGGRDGAPPPPPTCTCPTPDAALLNPTACCAGGSCVAVHYDGLSKSFADCYGIGSFVTPLALDACHAHLGAQATCTDTTCGLAQVVEGQGPTCITWAYQGSDTSLIGHVNVSLEAGVCQCPSATDPTWF